MVQERLGRFGSRRHGGARRGVEAGAGDDVGVLGLAVLVVGVREKA